MTATTRAALSVATDRTILVPSESSPGVAYRTSAKSCTCPDYRFKSVKIDGYRCKHMLRRFPAPRLCPVCKVNPILDLPTCSTACTRAARKLDLAAAVTEPYNSFEPIQTGAFCRCVRCTKVYTFTEDAPLLCPACSQVALHGERRAS